MKRFLAAAIARSRATSVEDLAADWLARRDAGFTAAEQNAFDEWLKCDPQHLAAAAELESTWRRINRTRESGQSEVILQGLAARRRQRRSRRFGVTAAGLGLAAAVAVLVVNHQAPTSVALPETVVVRPQRQVLADGSVVELNDDTEVSYEYTNDKRAVHLIRGEALFQVARNSSRPFVVTAGTVEVTAIGTSFAVRHVPQEVGVLVTEGRVKVERTPTPSSASAPRSEAMPISLAAGEQVVVPHHATAVALQPNSVSPKRIAAALAWRTKRVEFTGTALRDAVAVFNRQNQVQLLLDARLAEHRVSGIFWTNDPDGFARLLEGSFDIVVSRRDENHIHLLPVP